MFSMNFYHEPLQEKLAPRRKEEEKTTEVCCPLDSMELHGGDPKHNPTP